MPNNLRKSFISGTFNSVHAGHIRLFNYAKKISDKLVVGIFCDELSPSNINRTLEDRKLSLEALKVIDEVVEVDKDLISTIKIINPDIIVKGAEYQNGYNIENQYLDEFEDKRIVFSPGLEDDTSSPKGALPKLIFPMEYLKRHKVSFHNLKKILQKFKNKKVVVLGDTIIDEYTECNPLGMSQEDPTLVVQPIESKKFLGGAAIVAAHGKSLGADVHLNTLLGRDKEANFAIKELKRYNVNLCHIEDEIRPTILKTRIRCKGKTLLRISRLEQRIIEKKLQQKVYDNFLKQISNADLLIFSDFNYGFFSKELINKIIKYCNDHNVDIAADCQSSSQIGDISKYKNIKIITPTEREVRLALRSSADGLRMLSDKIKSKCNSRFVILTLGENGILITQDFDKTQLKTDQLPALNNFAIDAAGAGDSLLIVSALSLSCGASIWEASYLASIAAAIQVSRKGNIPITFEELDKNLNEKLVY